MVWIASRSRGGVSITDMSRIPERPICSVRGIGVADSVRQSTLVLSCFSFSFVRDAEALLLVDDQQAEVAEHHVLRQDPVRADQHVDGARRHSRRARP